MEMSDIRAYRLYQQQLTQQTFTTPEEVVRWLGAVQSQEYAPAKWSLGMRLSNANDQFIEQAFTDGAILRTHVMRPTWHFVAPDDIRWLLALTAPRVNAFNGYAYRQHELDDAIFARSNHTLIKALEGGRQLTRAELGAALRNAGINTEGLRLLLLVMRAELDAVICSGPWRGKQFTYMLLDERAPNAKSLPRDEALVELTKRYYTSHGPATVHDFSWWSGLTVADAKAGLAMCSRDLISEDVDGKTYWFSASMPTTIEPSAATYLLPTFDEFLVGFDSFEKSRRGDQHPDTELSFNSTIVINGKVAGTWQRTFRKGAVMIEYDTFAPLNTSQHEAIHAAAQRFGDFLGMPVVLA